MSTYSAYGTAGTRGAVSALRLQLRLERVDSSTSVPATVLRYQDVLYGTAVLHHKTGALTRGNRHEHNLMHVNVLFRILGMG